MTNLPSQHPSLSLHLTDSTLTPLITSSSSPSHLDSLTSLASTALTSHSAVARVSLGRPQRIMVEYPDRGAVVLQSYIEPQLQNSDEQQQQQQQQNQNQDQNHHQQESQAPVATAAKSLPSRPASKSSRAPSAPATEAGGEDGPPRLVSVVVAGSADQTKEARRAAARLERVGREFQREWATDSSRIEDDGS